MTKLFDRWRAGRCAGSIGRSVEHNDAVDGGDFSGNDETVEEETDENSAAK